MKQITPQEDMVQAGIAKWVTPILLSIVGALLILLITVFQSQMSGFDKRMEAIEKNQLILMSGEIRVQYLEKQIVDLQKRIEKLEDSRNGNKEQPISSIFPFTEAIPAKEYFVKRKDEYEKQPPM